MNYPILLQLQLLIYCILNINNTYCPNTTPKQKMQDKQKQYVNGKKDEQFKVHTLTENSSESSSRKDREYEISYYDDSDENQEQGQKKQIKSLQDLGQVAAEKEKEFAINNHDRNGKKYQQKEENLKQSLFLQQQSNIPEKKIHKASDDLNYEGQLEKKKQKRKKMLESIKIYNRNKNKPDESSSSNLGAGYQNRQKSVFNRVAFQKKRENHSLLKTWNYSRLKQLQLHKAVGQQLFKSLERNMRLSLQNFESYRTFFTQRAKQEQQYSNENASQIANEDLAIEDNRISQQIYIACSSSFQVITKKEKMHKGVVAQFAKFIQNKIIKEIFEEYFDNVYKQFVEVYQKVIAIREEVIKIDEAVCKKLINLQTNFSQCCENVNKQLNKDFYQTQLSFLRKCESQILIQNKYAQVLLEYYQAAINEQKKRKLMLQKSLRLFSDGLKYYENKLNTLSRSKYYDQNVLKSNKKIENEQKIQIEGDMEQIKQFYQLENLIQQQLLSQIKEKLLLTNPQQYPKNQSLSLQNFQKYFRKCQVEQFSCHHLLIKKFEIKVEKELSWIPGQIVITVDKFVHIFLQPNKRSALFSKPEVSLKSFFVELDLVENGKQQQTQLQNELIVRLTAKKPEKALGKLASLLKMGKNISQKIKFSNQNELFQFQDYIVQLSN